MNMSNRLEQMVVVIEDAAVEREIRLMDPQREPDETTEDDVITAMVRRQMPPREILRYKNPWTRALRIILKCSVDLQG